MFSFDFRRRGGNFDTLNLDKLSQLSRRKAFLSPNRTSAHKKDMMSKQELDKSVYDQQSSLEV
eukprot:scaffold10700_cov108-Cylindrotheca_fusiformis.AAC.12